MHKLNKPGFIFYLTALCCIMANSFAQSTMEDPRQDQLKELFKQSQEYLNTNKNSAALEVLKRYGVLHESIINDSKTREITQFEKTFNEGQKQRIASIDKKEIQINKLKSENESIDRENMKMTRNAFLFFGLLTGLAVIILLNRFRILARVKEDLDISRAHLKFMEGLLAENERTNMAIQQAGARYQEALSVTGKAKGVLNDLMGDKSNQLGKKTEVMLQTMSRVKQVLVPEVPQEAPSDAPQLTDLNSLIEEVIDLAYYSRKADHPEFNCTVVKDLEKILPKIEVYSEEIRLVLFSLFSNAFDALRDKMSNAPKGYEPKLTVSSRKLPRFVQIRIRDNGKGMTDKELEKVFDPFYSGRATKGNAGLGLSESHRIITVRHKGELIIESDPATGTDILLRFPTLALM